MDDYRCRLLFGGDRRNCAVCSGASGKGADGPRPLPKWNPAYTDYRAAGSRMGYGKAREYRLGPLQPDALSSGNGRGNEENASLKRINSSLMVRFLRQFGPSN